MNKSSKTHKNFYWNDLIWLNFLRLTKLFVLHQSFDERTEQCKKSRPICRYYHESYKRFNRRSRRYNTNNIWAELKQNGVEQSRQIWLDQPQTYQYAAQKSTRSRFPRIFPAQIFVFHYYFETIHNFPRRMFRRKVSAANFPDSETVSWMLSKKNLIWWVCVWSIFYFLWSYVSILTC